MKRLQAIRRIETFLNKHDNPRFQMTLTVLATALSGFIFSVALFWLGVDTIWIRYVSAILFAYGTFLLLLAIRIGTRFRDDFDPFSFFDVVPIDADASLPGVGHVTFESGGGNFGGGGATSSFGSDSSIAAAEGTSTSADVAEGTASAAASAADEHVLVVAFVAFAAFAGLCVAAYKIYVAPTLYAELLLDGAVSTALVRRLKDVDRQHWVKTAIRQTWFSVVLLILSFGIAGWLMQHFQPEANTLGQFIARITT